MKRTIIANYFSCHISCCFGSLLSLLAYSLKIPIVQDYQIVYMFHFAQLLDLLCHNHGLLTILSYSFQCTISHELFTWESLQFVLNIAEGYYCKKDNSRQECDSNWCFAEFNQLCSLKLFQLLAVHVHFIPNCVHIIWYIHIHIII